MKIQKFLFHYRKQGLWIRVFGHGIAIVNKHLHPPLFSERNGYRKVYRFGKWGIEFL